MSKAVPRGSRPFSSTTSAAGAASRTPTRAPITNMSAGARGVEIRYCAEQFENDGSVASTIVKTVKRAMAGEYSRELSAIVFAGQCRLIELGFRQGGHAGYGLRRRLVDQNGNPKTILAFGEQKSLQTDRVVLEPGPVEDVETVRRMFRMFVYEEKHQREIAAILNKEQIRTDLGR